MKKKIELYLLKYNKIQFTFEINGTVRILHDSEKRLMVSLFPNPFTVEVTNYSFV